MHKYLILIGVFITGLGYSQNRVRLMNTQALDLAQSAFYTGCMGGIIAVIESGLFKEGKDPIEANQNFSKLKQHCIVQSQEYRKFLE